jgi:hypothetical protein
MSRGGLSSATVRERGGFDNAGVERRLDHFHHDDPYRRPSIGSASSGECADAAQRRTLATPSRWPPCPVERPDEDRPGVTSSSVPVVEADGCVGPLSTDRVAAEERPKAVAHCIEDTGQDQNQSRHLSLLGTVLSHTPRFCEQGSRPANRRDSRGVVSVAGTADGVSRHVVFRHLGRSGAHALLSTRPIRCEEPKHGHDRRRRRDRIHRGEHRW